MADDKSSPSREAKKIFCVIFALLDPDPGSETLDSNKSYECGSTRIRARNNAHTAKADVDKDLGIVTFGRRKNCMKMRMKRSGGGGGIPGNVANSRHDLCSRQLADHVTVQQASANLQLRSLRYQK